MSDWDNFEKMFESSAARHAERFERNEKLVRRGVKGVVALWLFGALLSLALSIGLIVLIIVLIGHFA
jgi:hypothetical protein